MCGECLVRPVRALFAAHLHHGGYLRAAEAIAGRLLDLYEEEGEIEGEGGEKSQAPASRGAETERNNTTSAGSSSTNTNAAYVTATQMKPPDFLMGAWQHAMKLRAATRTFFLSQPVPKPPILPQPAPTPSLTPSVPSSTLPSIDQSAIQSEKKEENKVESSTTARTRTSQSALTVEEISDRLYGRILFLLQVEACSCDRLVEYAVEGEYGSGTISTTKDAFIANQTSLHDFEVIMGSNLSFIIDPRTSIPHIRAVLDSVQGASLCVLCSLSAAFS